MKKYISIILGVLVGIAVSAGMIYMKEERVAYGDINAWDQLVAGAANLKWGDVLGLSKGKNTYVMVRDKILDKPSRDAKKEIGKAFGLTVQEVENVLDGSIAPIFNNPKKSTNLTQEQATLAVSQLQEQFELLLEIYSLQQEIETSVTPSEIFSNGDTSDSGFDLIYDLSVIEEILFMEKSKNLVGDPFDKQMDSPVLPTESLNLADPYVESGQPGATLGSVVKGLTVSDREASIEVGGEDVDVGVLDEDVCPIEDDFSDVLGEYEDEFGDGAGGGAGGSGGSGGSGGGGGGLGGDDDDVDDDDDGGEEEIEAAESGDWSKTFCPNITSAPETGAGAGSGFGDAGFSSLGGVTNSIINQAAGAGAAFNEGGLAAYISVCLQTSFKKKTYTSYNPGDSCVVCEINKINENMNKTLRHSLVPNKATGNLMESAKCKDAGTLLNFQFISIAAPIPSPPNDDIIGLNNPFNEWKKMVDRYQPFLGYSGDTKLEDEFKLQFVSGSTTIESQFIDITKTKLEREAEALKEIENFGDASVGENATLFIQRILKEITLMNNFFSGYAMQYLKTVEQFPKIKQKPSF